MRVVKTNIDKNGRCTEYSNSWLLSLSLTCESSWLELNSTQPNPIQPNPTAVAWIINLLAYNQVWNTDSQNRLKARGLGLGLECRSWSRKQVVRSSSCVASGLFHTPIAHKRHNNICSDAGTVTDSQHYAAVWSGISKLGKSYIYVYTVQLQAIASLMETWDLTELRAQLHPLSSISSGVTLQAQPQHHIKRPFRRQYTLVSGACDECRLIILCSPWPASEISKPILMWLGSMELAVKEERACLNRKESSLPKAQNSQQVPSRGTGNNCASQVAEND